MSKITIEVDTQMVGINVSIDGKAITDVDSVSVFKCVSCCCCDNKEDDDEEKPPYVSITTTTEDEENGLRTCTHYSGAAEAIQSSVAMVSSDSIPGFLTVPKLADDIAKFLS